MNIKHAQCQKQKLAFLYEKEKVTLSYNRAALTPRFAREVRESAEGSEIESSVRMLGRLVLDWDLVDDEKQKVPFSAEILDDLDQRFIIAMMKAIWEDVIPPPEPATDSGSSF